MPGTAARDLPHRPRIAETQAAIEMSEQIVPGQQDHLLSRLGMRDVEDTDERLVIEMDNRPDLVNIRGAIQGGLVATLIDLAAGRLAGTVAGPLRDVTTADMNVHFVAPIIDGPAHAVATVVRAGRRLIVTSVDVFDAGRDRLAARATLTFAVLERPL